MEYYTKQRPMTIKEWLQYGSAIGVLASGMTKALLSFLLNGH